MRTRLLMVAACLGAAVVLGTSMAFSWPVAVGGGTSDVPTEEDQRAIAFDSPAGTCLFWSAEDGADMRRVDCAEPHLFEVTNNIDITADFPEDAPSPDVARWQDLAAQKCAPGATDYLGGSIDPFGRYKVNALKPSTAQWDDGDRKLRCGVQTASHSGALRPSTGSASGGDQSDIHEPGTCLALVGQDIGDPVPCDQEHAVEIIGNVDLTEFFPDGAYPPDESQIEQAIAPCEQVAAAYTNNADLTKRGLFLYSDARRQESWEAGSRRVDCRVAAKLPDNTGLAPVTGSVRGAVPSDDPAAPGTEGGTDGTGVPGEGAPADGGGTPGDGGTTGGDPANPPSGG